MTGKVVLATLFICENSLSKILAGNFTNDEFGNYILYSYTRNNTVVIIKSDKKTLVISGIDTNATKEIYETLSSK